MRPKRSVGGNQLAESVRAIAPVAGMPSATFAVSRLSIDAKRATANPADKRCRISENEVFGSDGNGNELGSKPIRDTFNEVTWVTSVVAATAINDAGNDPRIRGTTTMMATTSPTSAMDCSFPFEVASRNADRNSGYEIGFPAMSSPYIVALTGEEFGKTVHLNFIDRSHDDQMESVLGRRVSWEPVGFSECAKHPKGGGLGRARGICRMIRS